MSEPVLPGAPKPLVFRSFAEFYPFYLTQHQHPTCRWLHVAGTVTAVVTMLMLAVQGAWIWIPLAMLIPYPPGWIGHFVFEKNRPASFRWPLYSMLGDLAMARDVLLRRLPQ
jgi:hypothetical protein